MPDVIRTPRAEGGAEWGSSANPAFKYLVDLGTTSHGGGSFADLAQSSAPRLCFYRRSSDDPIRGDFESGPFVEVELDDCRRVLTPDNGLRQATPDLLDALS